MPKPFRSQHSRAVLILFALGLLIAFGGLAGLTATALGSSRADKQAAPPKAALRPARQGDLFGYADAAGRMVVPPRYELADTFSDGLALVRERGKFGYIDARGSLAIPADFLHALPFRNGIAAVRNDGDWIFLDRAGRRVAGARETPGHLASSAEDSF